MAINWDDQDILLMGSQLGKKLRHYKKGDVDEVTLNKLAIWFMDNYDDLYDIYRQSGRLLSFMDQDDTDFLENVEDNRPSLTAYEESLEIISPWMYYEQENYGQQHERFQAVIDNDSQLFSYIIKSMDRLNKRIKNIYASGLWVKPNPLSQELWALRTTILTLFAVIRFAIWYYPILYLRVSNKKLDSDKYWSPTHREIIGDFVENWFGQIENLDPLGQDLRNYVDEWKEVNRRKLYRQWGVDPVLLQEQRAFIKSLALLIRRGLSDRDRKATTFQDERYNTANELKALAQLGWSPELPPDIDVQECPKCNGQGYRSSTGNKKRKCTTCQGWGHLGEHLWLYQKGYNTGRHSRNPETRSWDISNENKRRQFDRLVSTFKSECVGNYKQSGRQELHMAYSPVSYFVAGIAAVAGVALFTGRWKPKVFGASQLDAAQLEEMQVERSGQTLDYVPVGLSQSFMGYQYLDLEHTTMVANDSPFGPGVIDHQVLYHNPYDLGYDIADESELMGDMNRRTHPMQEYVPKEMSAEAPGQGSYLTSWGQPAAGPVKVQHGQQPVTETPGVGPLNYSPRATVSPRYIPEAYRDFPYMVSLVDAPFVTPPASAAGDNRFGDLNRVSDEENYSGRFGKAALDPSVNAGYTDGYGNTRSLEQWSRTHTILRHTDTMVSAIPLSGGEELRLRRV